MTVEQKELLREMVERRRTGSMKQYPASGPDADAIEAALKEVDDSRSLLLELRGLLTSNPTMENPNWRVGGYGSRLNRFVSRLQAHIDTFQDVNGVPQ